MLKTSRYRPFCDLPFFILDFMGFDNCVSQIWSGDTFSRIGVEMGDGDPSDLLVETT